MTLPCALVCGGSHPRLAQDVARELNMTLTPCTVSQRQCGEVAIEVDAHICGADVYLMQPTCANDNIDLNTAVLQLLFLIRRLRLGGAARITAIVPFFAYSRQDRKSDLRCPISAAAVSHLVDKMGVDRVVTLDLHSGQIQGYFCSRAPMDNLSMDHEFAQYIRACRWFSSDTTVIVSPDAGGVTRAHLFADLLGVSHVVTVVKRRAAAGAVESMQAVGDVAGYSCIIFDDICDTGGTLVSACTLLRSMGAAHVVACVTHAIMTDPCCARINDCDALDEIVVSDSLPQERNVARCAKLKVLSIAALLAQAVTTYNTEGSISELFTRPATPSPRHHLIGSSRNSATQSLLATPYPEEVITLPKAVV